IEQLAYSCATAGPGLIAAAVGMDDEMNHRPLNHQRTQAYLPPREGDHIQMRLQPIGPQPWLFSCGLKSVNGEAFSGDFHVPQTPAELAQFHAATSHPLEPFDEAGACPAFSERSTDEPVATYGDNQQGERGNGQIALHRSPTALDGGAVARPGCTRISLCLRSSSSHCCTSSSTRCCTRISRILPETSSTGAGAPELWKQRVAVVGEYAAVVHAHVGPDLRVNEAQKLQLGREPLPHLLLGEHVTGKQTAPCTFGSGARELLSEFAQAAIHLFPVRRREIAGAHVLAEEFLVHQAVERGLLLLVGDRLQRTAFGHGLVAHRLIPFAEQHGLSIDQHDDAVNYVAGPERRCERRGGKQDELEPALHQNVCPMLKEKCQRSSVLERKTSVLSGCTWKKG